MDEQKNKLDFETRNDIEYSMKRLVQIFDSEILESINQDIYNKSVFIEVLILLRNLLSKLKNHFTEKIDFDDDVIKTKNIKNVTDLIVTFRNAACHSDNKDRILKSGTFAFNVLYGKSVGISHTDEKGVKTNVVNKYSDDIGFNMGEHILYLDRHIYKTYHCLFVIFEKHGILHKNH